MSIQSLEDPQSFAGGLMGVNAVEVNGTSAPEQEAKKPAQDFAVQEEKQLDYSKRSHGEKMFDPANWILGYGVTFVASVVGAYLFRDSSVKFPFKKKDGSGTQTFAEWTENRRKDIEKSALLRPFEKNQHFGRKRLSQIIMNTLVTFPGGFLMLPVERWMEHRKQSIVHWFNKRTGDEDQVKIGDVRTANHKVSGWGSLLLGRLTAITTVIASFMTLEVIAPNTMGGIEKDFERGFVGVGDKVSTLFSKYKKPLNRPRSLQDGSFDFTDPNAKAYKRLFNMGNLSAIDSIATAASVSVVFMTNNFLKKRSHKEETFEAPKKIVPQEAHSQQDEEVAPTQSRSNASQRVAQRQGYRQEAEKAAAERESVTASLAV
jgi:hypothetical protein